MLDEIIALKSKCNELEETIKNLKHEYGIDRLEVELEEMRNMMKFGIEKAVEQGITREGSIKITDTGRETRKVRTSDFYNAYPDLFWKCCDVRTTKAEEIITENLIASGLKKTEAKKQAKEELNEYCDKIVSHKYDIIDVLEGV